MAQQFIKIFDDTVLKQSINQGYETQRTNSRLGNFTMGELAFTRDTARLFVGNNTNLDKEKDSGAVVGGSIVGNKYLGMIDSKPLTHFIDSNEDKSSVYLPLNYEVDTVFNSLIQDENGINKTYTEKALFGKDSKFRTDKNDGWRKESIYNDKYDAYNGDYLYDVYNNALILFDTNIKPIDSITEQNWKIDEKTNEQIFLNDAGEYYTETGDKENYSTNRTRIHNVEKPNNEKNVEYKMLGNENYPIYGNGYVVFRLLEPDGITLGYKEKEFDQSTGKPTDNNYSHNYIELKSIPIDTLKPLFDSEYFLFPDEETDTARHITFTGNLDNVSISSITGTELSLPNKIRYNSKTGSYTIIYQNEKNDLTDPRILCLDKSTNEIDGTDVYTTTFQSPPTLTIQTNDVEVSQTLIPGESITMDLRPQFPETIETGFKVRDPFFTNVSNSSPDGTGNYSLNYHGSFIYSSSGAILAQEEIPGIKNEEEITISIPENLHAYFVLYDSSGPKSSYETYTEKNEETGEDEINYRGTLEHPYLSAGYNFLKEPLPIAWGANSTSITRGHAQFFINPFVISPAINDTPTDATFSRHHNKDICLVGEVNPSIKLGYQYNTKEETYDENGDVITTPQLDENGNVVKDEDGNDVLIPVLIDKTDNTVWNKALIEDNNAKLFDGKNLLVEALLGGSTVGCHIPDHAQSIICEIHFIPTFASLTDAGIPRCMVITNGNYSTNTSSLAKTIDSITFNDSIIDGDINLTTYPSITTKWKSNKLLWDYYPERLTGSTSDGTTTLTPSRVSQLLEIPLYRDKNEMKYFNIGVLHQNGSYVIRAIGYRA